MPEIVAERELPWGDSVSPEGNDPADTDQTNGAEPPEVVMAAEYAVLTIPFGNVWVTIFTCDAGAVEQTKMTVAMREVIALTFLFIESLSALRERTRCSSFYWRAELEM